MTSHSDESPEDFPARIEAAMHARLNELVTNRKPIIG